MPRHSRIEPALELPELTAWIEGEVGHFFERERNRKLGYVGYLLNAAYFRLLPHKNPIRYGTIHGSTQQDQFFESSSFNSRDLADRLGDGYREVLSVFFDFPSGQEGYSYRFRTTKPYILNERTLAKMTDVWRNSQSVAVINTINGEVIDASDLPSSGIIRPKKLEVHVPAFIPLSLDHVDRLIEREEAVCDATGRSVPLHRRRRFVRRLRTLYQIRHYARLLGGIPNLYVDTRKADWRTDGNGRLYGLGEFHLQRCPRDLRPLILEGSGWIDMDFKACHPTIFVALATAYGIAVPTWQDFLANRKARVEELSEAIDVRASRIKRIILALLYGQPLSASPKGALVDLIGKTGVERLRKNEYYAALKSELQKARPVIIARHQQGFQIKNAVGKLRAVRKKAEKAAGHENTRKPKRKHVHPRKLLSHVILGYEAWALRTVVTNTQDTKVLIHDGYITAAPPDINEAETNLDEESRNTWGFPLHLKLEASQPF